MMTISKQPEISVGIMSAGLINFELHGEFKSPGLSSIFSGRFSAEAVNDKIIIKKGNERTEVSNEIIFEPQDSSIESFLVRDVTIGSQFHWQRKEKQRFSGTLRLIKEDGKITLINKLPLEKYLISVVSSEMSSKSSLQLLKAHAVISRSWVLAQMQKQKQIKKDKHYYKQETDSADENIKWYDREDHNLFDVCADDHCQRYQGITKIFTEVARKAVEQTAGIVLTSNNKICDTRYSKSCGGLTESFENVWEPVKYEYLTSVTDYKFENELYNTNFSSEINAEKWIKGNPSAYCNTNDTRILSQVLIDYDQETKDFYRWKVEYSQDQLADIIRKKSGDDFGRITDLEPLERGYSSRVIKLRITGTRKTKIIGKELEIRRILSESHLYSSAVFIEKQNIIEGIPQKFVLYGAGWGHGVGLCQIGAAVMAERGHLFDEILLHYYKNAKIRKIY